MKKPASALSAASPKDSITKAAPARSGPAKKKAAKRAPLPAAAPDPAAAALGALVLDRLYTVVMERRTADPSRSHSARLLSRGPAKVAQKFGEEAVECLIEAVAGNAAALIGESADVLYHLVVMWVASGVQPSQVWAELERREGISGVDEKASRAGTSKIP